MMSIRGQGLPIFLFLVAVWRCGVPSSQASAFLSPAGPFPAMSPGRIVERGQHLVVLAASNDKNGGKGDVTNTKKEKNEKNGEKESTTNGNGSPDDNWYMPHSVRIDVLRQMEKQGEERQMQEANRKKAEKADAKSKVDEEKLKEKNRELLERCERNWKSRPISLRSAATLPNDQYVQKVKIHKNNIAYGSDRGYVGVSRISNRKVLLGGQFHKAMVTAIDYNGEYLISAADDYKVVVFREKDDEFEKMYELRHHNHRIIRVQIISKKQAVSVSIDGRITVWNLETGQATLNFSASDVTLAATYTDGYIFCGLLSGTFEAYSVRNQGRNVFQYSPQRCAIRSLDCYEMGDSIKVVAGGQDGSIRQFYVKPESSSSAWKLSLDHSNDDRLVLICNTNVGNLNQGYLLQGHKGPVVALKADERKIVSASEDGTLIVWDSFRGLPGYSIPNYDTDFLSSIDFVERYLVADGTGEEVLLWDYSKEPKPEEAS